MFMLQNFGATECPNPSEMSEITSPPSSQSSAPESSGLLAVDNTMPLSQLAANSVGENILPIFSKLTDAAKQAQEFLTTYTVSGNVDVILDDSGAVQSWLSHALAAENISLLSEMATTSKLADVAKQAQELLNSFAVHGSNDTMSDHQDAAQNLQFTTDMGASGWIESSQGLMLGKLFNNVMQQLGELRDSAASTLHSAMKQSMSGSDSGHDDCNSLPPDVSGDVVSDNVDTGALQQQSADVSCQTTDGPIVRDNTVSKIPSTDVQPAASKLSEFVARGNLILCFVFVVVMHVSCIYICSCSFTCSSLVTQSTILCAFIFVE